MVTLLSEIHFWTTQDDINIKDSDYGTFRYQDRKENSQNINLQSKKSYAEKRDYIWNLPNKRPVKLKDKLKELEEQIQNNKIVYCKWTDNYVLRIIVNTGLIINVCVNIETGDIQKISFDKYLIGKLLSENITDVLITRTHLLCTYNDNQCTVVQFNKILLGLNPCEKIGRLEPKITIAELAGPPGRKLDRTMSSNLTGDVILIWWRCMRDEVYPWSPIVKDQDRANIHIYHLIGSKLDLLCYRRTECDPINISFSKIQQHVIHCVEQKVSRKGEVTVETCTFEIVRNRLQQLLITSIPLQTQVCCHAFSPDNEKLLLGCIDGSIVLYDHGRGVTHLVKAAFIPSILTWHVDGAVIMVANEKCQIQCFDISLACIKSQIISEDITPSSILDLTSNFRNQPTLLQMDWNKKIDVPFFCGRFLQTDGLLLLLFEKGPLAILRLFSSSGLRGDVHSSGLTPDNLVYNYISMNQIDKAICILLSLNWDMYGISCLMSLQRIVNHLFKQNLTPEREAQIQRALGSFYVPLQPISASVQTEFGDQVKDIARKFFHLLIRYQLFEKAFCLAIDINDYDLFMDLYYYAQVLKDNEMANAAINKAKDLINTSDCSHSTCSRSSCSQCSDEGSNASNEEISTRDWNNIDVPPLPVTNKVQLLQPNLSTYMPPLPIQKNISYISPFPTIKTIQNTPQVPNIPQITSNQFKFYPQNINKISTINHNLTKPKIDIPVIRTSKTVSQNMFYDPNLRLKTPYVPKLQNNPSNNTFRGYNSTNNNIFSPVINVGTTTREIVHRTVSLNIPPLPNVVNTVRRVNNTTNMSNTSTVPIVSTPMKLSLPTQSTSGVVSKNTGEKNVKFSDTVTAFIVPEITRTDKPKEKTKRPGGIYMTDPKRELADSLPLCHPNEEYLKDFTPISSEPEEEEKKASKIQVVHFGMV